MLTELNFSNSFCFAKKPMLFVLLFFCTLYVKAQAPVISSFVPAIAGQSASISISGHNFTTATAVSFGGTPAAFFYVTSDTSIVAFVDNGSSGVVSVTNPNGSGIKAGFTFVPPPVISSFSPTSGSYGDTIRIKGQHFITVYNVFFGDSAALSFSALSDTGIIAVVSNGTSGQVTVSTIGGYGTITDFSYTGPHITSFSPSKGGSGTIVKIKGSHFNGATVVSFGGFAAASFIVNADTLITATVGAGGPGDVVVKTIKGTAAAPGFIVPYIKDFDPQSGTKYTEVTIQGLNLDATALVKFGDSSALSFIILSDTLIKAVAGNGESGAVSVNNGIYTASRDYFFYFQYQPLISSFVPLTAVSGTTITIRGSHFTGTTAVQFGNTAAASFFVVSDSAITAVVGNGSTGNVFVTNNNFTDSLAGFTYITLLPLPLCPPSGSTSISSNLSGTNYQWQLSTNNGNSFSNISNTANYNGVTNSLLQLNNIPSSFTGNIYRCVVNGNNSDQRKLQFINNWTGAVNTFWNNTGNWSCGTLPDANTDVLISSGTIVLNSNGNCRSLTVSPGVNFTANTGFKLTVSH
ncbi:MAG: IPT/TIG domain-containing protein [Chitinophagaceae bacterium]|nr:IPT/TIG domain-containing protein [Chitinophagaceae bacterium]